LTFQIFKSIKESELQIALLKTFEISVFGKI
jgi:hypothetical protein